MNISEYSGHIDSSEIFSGNIALMKGMRIINGDETAYKFLGINAARPITALIHPEDLASFEESIEMLSVAPQHLIIRLMDFNAQYRYMYLIMSYSDRVEDDFRIINIDIQDIIAAHQKYDRIRASVFKYRKFMTFSTNVYFEYYYDEELITIYEYANGRSNTLFCDNIKKVEKMICSSDQLSKKQKDEFRTLYACLVGGVDNVDVIIDGAVFGIHNYYLQVKGGIIFDGEDKYMLAAVVKKISHNDIEVDEKYYMTSYAIDSSTGAYNKRAITEIAHDVIDEATDDSARYICMIDIDDFKQINDNYGHMAGDKVIAQVASTIRRDIETRGYVGRFGGDEFVVITDKIKDDNALIYLLKTIRKNLAFSCKEIGANLNVTLSIGISKYPDNGRDYDTLFNIADKCVYIAKENGKNRYILYNPKLHGEDGEDSELTEAGRVLNPAKRYSVVYDIMSFIDKYKKKRMDEFMTRIMESFDIDGISLFDKNTKKRVHMYGTYDNQFDTCDFMDDIIAKMDFNGVFAINKILSIAENSPYIFEKLNEQHNSGVLFVNGEKYIIEYDIFNRSRKWSESDKGMLMMLARRMDANL